MTKNNTQEERIEHILGKNNIKISEETLEKYLSYLQKHIVFPCELTGREDFSWEEIYIYGSGNEIEYEELKKSQPSYQDIYTFLSFDDLIDDDAGLMVNVQRVSDRKQFVLPLVDLKATDENSQNSQLIDEYAVWYVTY